MPKGPSARPAKCPHCASLERHRFLWLYLQKHKYHWRGATILHIGAEPCLRTRLPALGAKAYLATDLHRINVDLKSDITALPLAASTVDLLIASHVLEHVEDDRAAFREICRVLSSRGIALLQIPYEFTQTKTLEVHRDASPQDRRRLLGHWTHQRAYGQDFPDRLRLAGLASVRYQVQQLFTEREIFRCGLSWPNELVDRESIWACTVSPHDDLAPTN